MAEKLKSSPPQETDFQMATKELARVRAELAIANKRIELLKEEGFDLATGLWNEWAVEPKLERLILQMNYYREHGEAEPRKSTLGAIMVVYIDLDHLKLINDTYGHDTGNKAIVAIAKRLREVSRETDLKFHLHNGDEFLLVLPIEEDNIDAEVLDKIAENLKQEINSNLSVTAIKEGRERELLVSASLGYSAIYKGENKTVAELINEADEKMYADKKARGKARED